MPPGALGIAFNHVFGDQALERDVFYATAAGEQVQVNLLQYYISNIKLRGSNGTMFVVPADSSYFLIRETQPESLRLTLKNVPAGSYNGIAFMIGVDSARSRMGLAQRRGVLDVADEQTGQGMYWTWNSGYIFYRIEGYCPQSTMELKSKRSFLYHVGGYGGTDSARSVNNLRVVSLALPAALVVKRGVQPKIHVQHDVKKVWGGPNVISIAENPMAHFNTWSANVANNYATGFTITHVE